MNVKLLILSSTGNFLEQLQQFLIYCFCILPIFQVRFSLKIYIYRSYIVVILTSLDIFHYWMFNI